MKAHNFTYWMWILIISGGCFWDFVSFGGCFVGLIVAIVNKNMFTRSMLIEQILFHLGDESTQFHILDVDLDHFWGMLLGFCEFWRLFCGSNSGNSQQKHVHKINADWANFVPSWWWKHTISHIGCGSWSFLGDAFGILWVLEVVLWV